jgi:CYTH domain-containing protein
MKELERRFLVNRDLLPKLQFVNIRQGYLIKNSNSVLRIRVVKDPFLEYISAFLCFKIYNTSIDRDEYEYSINPTDGEELLKKCEKILHKRRYIDEIYDSEQEDYVYFHIDEYSNGLIIADVEYKKEFPKKLPEWIEEEVTGILEYSNLYLIENI